MARTTNYGSVRALVAVEGPAVRDGLTDAFAEAGLPAPDLAATPDEMRAALAAGVDLVVMSHELEGVFVAPLIAEVRRGLLGPHSFPIVVVLVPADAAALARKVSDCGPDDIMVLPAAPAAILHQIGIFAGGARKPLVVTPGYAGPERRTDGRAVAQSPGT